MLGKSGKKVADKIGLGAADCHLLGSREKEEKERGTLKRREISAILLID